MRIPYILTVTAVAFMPVAALAQADRAAQIATVPQNGDKNVLDGSYLTVGGGAVYGPSYEGSKDYVVFPVPVVQGRLAGVSINPRAGGAALNFIPSAKGAKIGFALGPVATYSANRDRHIVDPVVAAAGRLNADISIGVSGGVSLNRVIDRYDSLSANVDVKWDVRGPHGGMEVLPSVSYITPLSKATLLTLAVSAKHVNNDYANYYYSVSSMQSLASGLPLYQAHGGWASVGGTMLLAHSLSGDLRKGGFSIFAVGGYTRLLNDARYNPYTAIRGTPTQFVGGGGLAFTF